ACPTGGPEVAHQIINTGQTTMRYLSLSTLSEVEACEYPDSRKVGIYAGEGADGLRKMFRAEGTVDYYDREPLCVGAPGRRERPCGSTPPSYSGRPALR